MTLAFLVVAAAVTFVLYRSYAGLEWAEHQLTELRNDIPTLHKDIANLKRASEDLNYPAKIEEIADGVKGLRKDLDKLKGTSDKVDYPTIEQRLKKVDDAIQQINAALAQRKDTKSPKDTDMETLPKAIAELPSKTNRLEQSLKSIDGRLKEIESKNLDTRLKKLEQRK